MLILFLCHFLFKPTKKINLTLQKSVIRAKKANKQKKKINNEEKKWDTALKLNQGVECNLKCFLFIHKMLVDYIKYNKMTRHDMGLNRENNTTELLYILKYMNECDIMIK